MTPELPGAPQSQLEVDDRANHREMFVRQRKDDGDRNNQRLELMLKLVVIAGGMGAAVWFFAYGNQGAGAAMLAFAGGFVGGTGVSVASRRG